VRIFEYSLAGIHPSVARALYNGQLFLSDRPELGIHHDFEFHNGALYTHWGYGVPLLQMPFHLLATAFSSGPGFHPFPDRAIFLFYLLLGTALFWLALRRLAERGFRLGEWAGSALATASTAFFLTYGLYWLVSMYFGVYEATVAYLALAEFSVARASRDPVTGSATGMIGVHSRDILRPEFWSTWRRAAWDAPCPSPR